MDAVKFINGRERMCGSFNGRCTGCGIAARLDQHETCHDYVRWHPAEAVEIVERWVKAHPLKTRQSEFLKMFPRTNRIADGVMIICPESMDSEFECPHKARAGILCKKCQRDFWLAETEDDEAEAE